MKLLPIFAVPYPALGELLVSPAPGQNRSLETDVQTMVGLEVKLVVSLLQEEEAKSLGLAEEGAVLNRAGIQFKTLPIPDFGVPESVRDFTRLTSVLKEDLQAGKNVLIHCRGGIGRSSLITLSLLIASGMSPEEARKTASDSRTVSVPETEAQWRWLLNHSKAF